MKHLWILVVGLGLLMPLRAEEELFTNVYVVPPTFLTIDYPFTPEWKPAKTPEERYKQPVRPTAKAKLEEVGITFPEGASAIYNPATAQLIVRNTEDQMELVEAYIESIVQKVEKQVYLTVREMRFQGELSEFLKAKGWNPSEGASELDPLISGLFEFPSSISDNQGETRSFVFDSYDSFREELARPPKSSKEFASGRKIRQAETLSDARFQVLIRRLSQMKGIDFLSLPSVMARSGQPALTRTETQRYGIVAVLGADEKTIDLDLFLPKHGEALYGGGSTGLEPTIRTRVLDGDFVVIAEKNANGENRLVFVQAQLMDPAGMPIHPKAPKVPEKFQEEPVELPTKSDPADLSPEEKEAVKQADQIALEASTLLAEGKLDEAFALYGKAVALLPKHEFTKPRREAYEKQAFRARDGMSKRTSDTGVHVVGEGETLEQIAARLGVAEEALRELNRLGDAPLKHGQILLIPAEAQVKSRTKALLEELILPGINFKDANLLQSIMMLQQEILRLHDDGLFPEATPIFLVDVSAESLSTKVTLRLSNVPAAEALRYIVSLARCRYEVDGREVRIVPQR